MTAERGDSRLDSRDIIERIAELTAWIDDENDSTLRDDYREELTYWQDFAEQAAGYCADWQDGAQLIRDDDFRDFAQELAEDCGLVDGSAGWPMSCIDWEQAARELRMDYTAVEVDGLTYWLR